MKIYMVRTWAGGMKKVFYLLALTITLLVGSMSFANVDCGSLLADISSYRPIAWALSQGNIEIQKRIFKILTISYHSQDSKHISLLELIPSFAKKFTNKYSPCRGPNCWNASLNWDTPILGVGPVDRSYIEAQLTSKSAQYTIIRQGALVQFGNHIVIRNLLDNRILHSGIYIDDETIWHKPSAAAEDPWTFQKTSEMLKHYAEHFQAKIEFYRYNRK